MNHSTLICKIDSEPRFSQQSSKTARISFRISCPTKVVEVKLYVLAFGALAQTIHEMNLKPNDWLLLSGTLEGSNTQEHVSFILIAKDASRLEIPAEIPQQAVSTEVQNSI